MKKRFRRLLAFFCLFFALPVLAVVYPDHRDDYVNDFASVLSAPDALALSASLKDIQQRTGIQLVVVTVNALADYDGGSLPIYRYAGNLFDRWGIGDKTRNDGILIFFSLKDREVWIEMGQGYAHRYDRQMQEVVDSVMLPRFKEARYSEGIQQGALAVVDAVTQKVSWFSYYKWHLLAGAVIVICVLAGISCLISGKKGWGWALIAFAGVILLYLLKNLKSAGRRGGGFGGGFGGGRGGGGGAGGKW
ncbi:MAG: TPM domain-containing protein [Candidatus Accumulibacter sp.]|jgi:uncharacterized protein|nr:TPM domain-containing protein [Accumulibacter sp.]